MVGQQERKPFSAESRVFLATALLFLTACGSTQDSLAHDQDSLITPATNSTEQSTEQGLRLEGEKEFADLLETVALWNEQDAFYFDARSNSIENTRLINNENLKILQELEPLPRPGITQYGEVIDALVFDYLVEKDYGSNPNHFIEQLDSDLGGDQVLLRGALPENPTNLTKATLFRLANGTVLHISYEPEMITFTDERINSQVEQEGSFFRGNAVSEYNDSGDASITVEDALLNAIYIRQQDGSYKRYDVDRTFSSIYFRSEKGIHLVEADPVLLDLIGE